MVFRNIEVFCLKQEFSFMTQQAGNSISRCLASGPTIAKGLQSVKYFLPQFPKNPKGDLNSKNGGYILRKHNFGRKMRILKQSHSAKKYERWDPLCSILHPICCKIPKEIEGRLFGDIKKFHCFSAFLFQTFISLR